MSRAEAHLGVSPAAPSQDEPTLTLEQVGQSSHANFKMSKLAHFVEVSMVMVPWGSPHVRAAVMDVVRIRSCEMSQIWQIYLCKILNRGYFLLAKKW